ncbi:MAG: phospholipase D family protein [Phycisphaeraceae bacterium]|nr:phospholipase D family protein [Phycisphaeraceae bacterium]
MTFRLVDMGWGQVLGDALAGDRSGVRMICPFIKHKAAERLFGGKMPASVKVITRFSLDDFARGVNDLSALRLLLERGASVRGVKHLHAKVYLFGKTRAVVTSANLTQAALGRNHEFGFVSDDAGVVGSCGDYFEALWVKAGKNLTIARLEKWEQTVKDYLARAGGAGKSSVLGDEGADAGLEPEAVPLPARVAENDQAFVKFFGESHRRAERSMAVLEEVRRSGCHWACTYPKGKRPRQVRDGAVMFMGRMVKEPADILIYGRAIGLRHVEGRDDATPEDIALRSWKTKWPHYVRVHHGEFLAGPLENALSLNTMMETLGSSSFLPTQRNAKKGNGNTDPRKAYRQQAAVALTPEATAWLNDRLQDAFDQCGTLPAVELAALDQPTVAVSGKWNRQGGGGNSRRNIHNDALGATHASR